VTDSDFEIEVKFDSVVTQKYQLQGILVEQDEGNLIRFDFYGRNGQTRSFVSTFVDGTPTVLSDTIVSPAAPMYMRVKREGDVWTQSISSDGTSWSTLVSFSHPVFVTTVSLFAGNVGSSAPAHDALIDYFHVLSQ
jgi:regulation of enolase protein 1 (concanavalin A-like superfamily)